MISQHYDVQVYRAHVLTGNTAVLTCIIPAQVQDYVTVTSWYKDEHILLPGRSDVGEFHYIATHKMSDTARYYLIFEHYMYTCMYIYTYRLEVGKKANNQ